MDRKTAVEHLAELCRENVKKACLCSDVITIWKDSNHYEDWRASFRVTFQDGKKYKVVVIAEE